MQIEEEIPTPVEVPPAPPAPVEVADSSIPSPYIHVCFNKYYYEMLKTLKASSKVLKNNGKVGSNEKAYSKAVIRSIQGNYATFDKLSSTHINEFQEEGMAKWLTTTYSSVSSVLEELNNVVKAEDATLCMYKGIPLYMVCTLLKPLVVVNYLSTFGILLEAEKEGWGEDKLQTVLDILKNAAKDPKKIEDIENEAVRHYIMSLISVHIESVGPSHEDLLEIESTSLGKLAKEIVAELNIGGENGNELDLLAQIQSSDGIGKLISSVGSKIQNKLSSGELNQQSLIQDAMALATKLPKMMPGMAGGMGGAGGENPFAGMEGLLGNMNLGDIMGQMQSMMGAFGAAGAGPAGGSAAFQQATKKASTNERLKRKLADKKRNGN